MCRGQACSVISLILFLGLGLAPASGATAPTPKPKPQIGTPTEADGTSQATPPPKPSRGGRSSGATFYEVDGAVPVTWPAADITAARAACSKLLTGLELKYKTVEAIGGPGGCGAAAPIEVSAVAGIVIEPPATLTCKFAKVLHRWARGALQQAAKAALNDRILSLTNVASYTCRTTRSERASRLSEHALSNALDISAFNFEINGKVSVTDDWAPNGAPTDARKNTPLELGPKATFLRYAHESACEVFSTVLGPDHNAFHNDHLHLDHGRDGRFGACQ